MNKKILTSLIIVILSVLVLVPFNSGASEKATKVRIGYLNIVASLPLFVAEEKGYLKQEGIDYETLPVATSNQLVDAIVAKNLDCFIESSAVPVLAVELQSPGRLKVFSVSEITPKAPFDALLVKENSSIRTMADLKEKKVGVFPGSTATNLLRKHLKDMRIDVSTVIFVPVPPQNQLTALMEGSIDALHAYEPTTAIALSKGGFRKLYGSIYADMLSPNPQGVAVVGTNFIEKYPQASTKVIRALERAMVYMKKHDAETRQILMKRLNLSEDVAKKTVFLYMLPHNELNTAIFQRYADMLKDLGELSGQVNVKNLIYSEKVKAKSTNRK